MGSTKLLTDKDHIAKIFNLAFHDFDSFTEKYNHYFHEKNKFNYYDANLGEYVEKEGKNEALDFMKKMYSMYDFTIDNLEINQERNKIVMFYSQLTTEKSPYYTTKLSGIEGLSVWYIQNNQVMRVKNILDTFQVLKLIGNAVMQSNDEVRVNQYLQNLITTGIISSEYLN